MIEYIKFAGFYDTGFEMVDAVRFNELLDSDIPCRADTKRPFKTIGTPVRHLGPVKPKFYNTLCDAAANISTLLVRPTAIVFANVFRKKKDTEKVNRHAEGRAADICGVFFPIGTFQHDFVDHAEGCAADICGVFFPIRTFQRDFVDRVGGMVCEDARDFPARYLAVEACLRLSFGTVLDEWYGNGHDRASGKPHLHVDTGSKVMLRKSDLSGRKASRVCFLQAYLRHVAGCDPGTIDGRWGPKTAAAWKKAKLTDIQYYLGVGPWKGLLRKIAQDSWKKALTE